MSYLVAALFEWMKGGLVVSCQASTESPLHHPMVISSMALAAQRGGAVGVRIESPEHIEAVRARVECPIIGLWKRDYSDSSVYITPTCEDARAVARAGADIIAIDGTRRDRPYGEDLAEIIHWVHQECDKPVLADIDDWDSASFAEDLGADAIATTLWGYTEKTSHGTPPNLELLQQLIETVKLPVILEGGVHHPEIAKNAIAMGAWAVVVGQDITGIDHKISQYCQHLASLKPHDGQS